MNLAIVENRNGQLVTSSEVIAEHTGNQHKNILDMISKYSELFKNQPTFETRPGYNNSQVRIAMLDEQQATFLITLLRNNDDVVEFKSKLVNEFFRMRDELNNSSSKAVALPSKRELALMVVEAEDKIEALEGDNKRLNRVCNDLAGQLATGLTPPKFAKLLNGVNSQQIQNYLIERSYLKRCQGANSTGIEILHKSRATGRFIQNWVSMGDKNRGEAHVTELGAKWLYKLYIDGKLPMMTSWNGSYVSDIFLSEKPQIPLEPDFVSFSDRNAIAQEA